MQGIWLVSYVILWLFVLLQTALLVALLRHIGNLRLWLREAGVIREPVLYEEGPPIGTKLEKLSEILKLDGNSYFEDGVEKAKLLVFVPAGFFGCDELLPALKEVEELYGNTLQVVLVSFEPAVDEQFDVARLKGIQAPIFTKYGWKVGQVCNILTAPYALIVDHENVARAKLPVGNFEGLEKVIHTYQSNIDSIEAKR